MASRTGDGTALNNPKNFDAHHLHTANSADSQAIIICRLPRGGADEPAGGGSACWLPGAQRGRWEKIRLWHGLEALWCLVRYSWGSWGKRS